MYRIFQMKKIRGLCLPVMLGAVL
ncbi:fimbrial protein, partial [Escherichia coli]|nr:fimbrial protein [Escherichia coli]EFD4981626.1 fimbrial protein [Escherichia coli]EFD5000505.1 fimbrial protein [Escherichia coli]EFE8191627.1 fimbrial protein [Escherichia coli]EFH9510518.1 fimbrial protein [Escherichia coli]